MIDPTKAQIAEKIKFLHERRTTSPEVIAMLNLLSLLFEQAKDTLVSSPQNTFLAAQARAATYERLHKQILQGIPSVE